MTKIEVLGTGCAKCKRLFANAEQAVKDLKITAEVIKVDDIDEIVNRGVMMTPALFINGQVRAEGRVTGRERDQENVIGVKTMAEQQPTCSCGANEPKRIIFPCAGQANVGQLTNLAALQLTEEGYGNIACLALIAIPVQKI